MKFNNKINNDDYKDVIKGFHRFCYDIFIFIERYRFCYDIFIFQNILFMVKKKKKKK